MNGIRAVLNDERWSAEMKAAIETIWNYLDNLDTLKLRSKYNYLYLVRTILLKTLIHPTIWQENTIVEIMEDYRRKKNGAEYSQQYRNNIRVVIKYILLAFERKELVRICGDETTRTGQLMKMAKTKTTIEQLDTAEPITLEHMAAITSQMPSGRVRVFFWLLWDIGARFDDQKMMSLGDIEFDISGVGLILWVPNDTKTGKRPTRPRYTLARLKKYLADHPYGARTKEGAFKHPDVALFLNNRGQAWGDVRGLANHLYKAVKKVRELEQEHDWPFPTLPKVITMQTIRRNAVNRDRDEGMDIEANAIHHGHSVPVMMKFYRKRDRKDVIKREFDRLSGIVQEEEKEKEAWHTCPVCHHQNPPANEYCAMCGSPVSLEAMKKQEGFDERLDRLIAEQEELRKLVLEQIKKDEG